MPAESCSFLPSRGGMSDAIRSHPWAATTLGAVEEWPDALKTTVALVLGSGFPQAVVWGAERITLYNDAFVPILGAKPAPLGKPFDVVWSEAWAEIGPIWARAFAGEPTFVEDFPLIVQRENVPERAYFTFCYSPIRDESGNVVGMLDTVVETTATVENARRLAFLDELSRTVAGAADAADIMASTTSMVAGHLGLSNCAYADIDAEGDGFTIRGDWAAPGVAHVTGHYSLAAFSVVTAAELGAGRLLIVDDVAAQLQPHEAAAYQAIGVAATVCVPLLRDERLVALMAIHDRSPRRWSSYDLALIKDVAERSWAHVERVRADAEVRIATQALQDLNASLELLVERRTAQLMEAEAALRQAQKMEAIGQLTGGIAHDFNNLLTGISGSLELIERRIAQGRSDDLARFVGGAQASAQSAAALIQRMLAFSRRQTLDPKPTDVNRLVSGMGDLIRRTVGPAIDLDVIEAAGLWPVEVDAAQLESALLNLAINARDAMPEGGRLTVQTSNLRLDPRPGEERDTVRGEYVCIAVTDTGAGIPDEILDRIFEPFFTTKPIGQGTGLGLSMIHGFVSQSGGQVRIRTALGHGTTFCLYLPRYHGEVGAGAAREIPAISGLQGCTVLVIDDEPTVRTLIVEVLREAGHHAFEAGDAPSGLAIVNSGAPIDLLITDVGLPGMSGRQLVREARAVRPGLKTLFVTGYAEDAAGQHDPIDPTETIAKPFALAELARKIAEALQRRAPPG